MHFIDTHAHLDGAEFDADRDEVVGRARAAGVSHVLIPAIDLPSVGTVLATCDRYPGFAHPMIGLHPEEVNGGYREVLASFAGCFRPDLWPLARWDSTIIGAVSLRKSNSRLSKSR